MLPQQLQNTDQNYTFAGSETFSFDYRIFRDIDQQINSINGWSQIYEPLSPRTFLDHTIDLCFNDIQLFRETTRQQLYQTGLVRSGFGILAVPMRFAAQRQVYFNLLVTGKIILLSQ